MVNAPSKPHSITGSRRIQVDESLCGSTMSKIDRIRSDYIHDRAVFLDGVEIAGILLGLGATEDDLNRLRSVSDGLTKDPTLSFRKTRNGRYCFDADGGRVYRLEFNPYLLSPEEDFIRLDSGITRHFDEVGNDLQLNSAVQALFAFKYLIFHDVPFAQRRKLDYSDSRWVCTLFNIRTITEIGVVGEPAIEGVHTDGVDHTMTTFVGSDNMTDDSAVTFVHDMREKTANRWYEADESLLTGRYQHRNFLDTLIVVDHERKHSVSPVKAVDPQRPATRDMLIFFTRKPVTKDHPTYPYDSLKAHPALPMSADLRTFLAEASR
jgi:hypothetical protein